MTGLGDVVSSGPVCVRPRWVQPLDGADAPRNLVPVTTWVHPDLLISGQPHRPAGQFRRWRRNPYLLMSGVVLGVGVAATVMVCVVIALLALVAWVSAHAVAVGVGIAAVVVSALVVLRALTNARHAGPALRGGCCEWEDHYA